MASKSASLLTITLDGETGRLDKVVSARAGDLSRARLQKLIEEGALMVDGKPVTNVAHKLKGSETITVAVPPAVDATPRAQKIPLDIVFEDKHVLVINKPAGMVVHPAAGNLDGTLVNALLAHCGDSLSGIGGVKRPGIVHRLDKDTSGLMVVAKHDEAHQGLCAQFAAQAEEEEMVEDDYEWDEELEDFVPIPAERLRQLRKQQAQDKKQKTKTLSRIYHALIWGAPLTTHSTLTGNIGRSPTNRKKMAIVSNGKPSITHVEVLERYAPASDAGGYGAVIRKTKSARKENMGPYASLVQCVLETGRTHQIRVHLSHAGHSLIGDPLYGNAKGSMQRALSALEKTHGKDNADIAWLKTFPRQALHAKQLSFLHPVTGKALSFDSKLPDDMQKLKECLERISG